ncbi:lipoate--protein ligase family protein [Pantanalinema sp. GBBB05]|uniref:lipoate--protein ligase family protein n=1 Tax=Pantanalinema sp. GBBB05 TaxID=2604139 RepID=UPI001D4073B9|nr:lipoate--protein ligase family protein [Pantanalinema sp. GBBB05]
MQIWRYIPPLVASGKLQMALDTWLFEQHLQGKQPPILRFYTWEPAAISLGYHQRQWSDHWQDLTWQGQAIDLVRRPTGGRAVLHQGDLTYAVIMSGLPGKRMQAYQQICEFLIQGWRSLGVDLHYGQAGRGYIHNPNCFGTATTADLVVAEGRKLIGSAQLRRGSTVLQHGSMRLAPDPVLFRQVFNVEPELPQLSLPWLGEDLMVKAITALLQAAQSCFAADFQEQPLSESEWQVVNALAIQLAS